MTKNKTLYLNILKELNESKVSSEEHSLEVISKIDDIIDSCDSAVIDFENIKSIAFELIDMMQHHDLNRQKVERVMNIIIDNTGITDEELSSVDIKKLANSAKHIDSNDGDAISDEELEKLIATSQ